MSNILKVAAKSASYNIIFQMLMRIMTFILNAFILRYVSEEVLGVINVRLLLLYTTIQFLSRESFRRACITNLENQELRQTVNVLWLIVPISSICGCCMGYIWLNVLTPPSLEITSEYHIGVISVVIAVIIEAIAEPLFVIMQKLLFVKIRVFIEGTMLLIRTITLSILVQIYPRSGVWDFSCAIILGSIGYLLIYFFYVFYCIRNNSNNEFPLKKTSDILPTKISEKPLFDARILALVKSFFKQGVLKQLLTEGIYDVVNNLGSLAARFIFAPIEESSYLFFTQMVPRGFKPSEKDSKHSKVSLAASVLEHLVKMMTLLSITILTFGYFYSPLLLHIYGGIKLSSGIGPTLLRFHCLYIVLLAINGITEAFVFASMTQKEVDQYNHKMVLFAIIFITLSLCFTSWFGSVGFILANCGNMCLRIAHSLYYIHFYYKKTSHKPIKGLLPSLPVIFAYCMDFVILWILQRTLPPEFTFKASVLFIFCGMLCLSATLVLIALTEKSLIHFIITHLINKKERKSE
ncbi:Protein RFT1 [Nymphon striatum]|nr:Protein RFT1 [Nymphon striatum]